MTADLEKCSSEYLREMPDCLILKSAELPQGQLL
jgi:hypothetical protein